MHSSTAPIQIEQKRNVSFHIIDGYGYTLTGKMRLVEVHAPPTFAYVTMDGNNQAIHSYICTAPIVYTPPPSKEITV